MALRLFRTVAAYVFSTAALPLHRPLTVRTRPATPATFQTLPLFNTRPQLYSEAGVPTRQFVGVPVFQAEGLTVASAQSSYVPLFLAREDLDAAVQAAYAQRNGAQIATYRERAAASEAEWAAATAAAAKAQVGARRGMTLPWLAPSVVGVAVVPLHSTMKSILNCGFSVM